SAVTTGEPAKSHRKKAPMPITSTAIDHRAEIDKLFDSLDAAYRSRSAFTYVLPPEIEQGAGTGPLARSDEALITGYQAEGKAGATAEVEKPRGKIEQVFRSGVGDTPEGHEDIDEIFNEQDAAYQQQSDEARAKAKALYDKLSTPQAKDRFLKVLKDYG